VPKPKGIDDFLSFEFVLGKAKGKVSLPKALELDFPVSLRRATFFHVISKLESTGVGTLSISSDVLPYVTISLTGSGDVDKRRGSADLTIGSKRKVCRFEMKEAIRAQVTEAEKKLREAADKPVPNEEAGRLDHYKDVAKAIGGLYETTKKLDAACTEIPGWFVKAEAFTQAGKPKEASDMESKAFLSIGGAF